ncbi:MAG: AMP-binding protein [Deltaproteobacteria bacterium]|nr:AMP-binding protein [Deltaproteobacteria bacterium]
MPYEMRLDSRGLRISEDRPEIPGGLPQSVADVLAPGLSAGPRQAALIGRSRRFSYAELDAEVNRAARALGAAGIEPGSRLAVCLPNDVDIVIAFLASQRIGAVWVGINRPLAPPEKAYILRDSGAQMYIVADDLEDELASESLAGLQLVSEDKWRSAVANQKHDELKGVEIDPHQPAAIAYTSGTTGLPKGAVHSQHNILLPGAATELIGGRRATPRQGVILPLTILNLMILGPVKTFIAGACCVCIDRIDAVGLAAWIRDERVTGFDAVPTIVHDLLTHPDVSQADLQSLTHPGVGGGDAPPELMRLYRERFHQPVTIGYGMTEAPTAVSWHTCHETPTAGLCGQAVDQIELEILDRDDHPLPIGDVGEICIRPSKGGKLAGIYTPMLGYWGKPEATREALRGGRYHTGDLGFLDAEGNLTIRGRRNELILRGGANVYPAEVERALGSHPAVAAAAVLGIPDDRLGERVIAVVQVEPGHDADEQTLRSHVQERLARYKVPDSIHLQNDPLPRNAMNKIVKPKLRELFEDSSLSD